MRNAFGLYFKYIGIAFRCQLQYRASFIMMTLGHFAVTIVDFLGIWVLFARFGSLKDWTLPEVALFSGIINISFALSEAGARGFDILPRLVANGDFDRVLLRPRSTVLQIIGQDFQLMRAGRFLQGIIILLWSVSALNLTWSPQKIILLVMAVVGGTFLFSGLFVLQATLSFWSVQSLEIVNSFTYGGVETAQFPLSIYKKWFRGFFIFIIPLACANYFPAIGILGKADPLATPVWLQWFSPLVGVLFFIISLQIWKIGVRHYHSTGS